MKKIKVVLTAILLVAFTMVQAQNIEYNGVKYLVKKNAIFVDKVDVTNTLSLEEQASIKNALSEQILAEKRLKEAEKAQKEAEKAQRKAEKKQKAAEKKQKKAEKEIKAKEKAKQKYADAQENYEKALKRSEKLRERGKLSPVDEVKWQKKLEGYKNKIEKAKRKL